MCVCVHACLCKISLVEVSRGDLKLSLNEYASTIVLCHPYISFSK